MKSLRYFIFIYLVTIFGCNDIKMNYSLSYINDIPIIEIGDLIEKKGVNGVLRLLNDACEENPRAVVITINSGGGELTTLEKLAKAIQEVEPPIHALVKKGHAGAILPVLAADYIYMEPDGTLGCASPPFASSQGDPLEKDEKLLVYVENLISVTASKSGHDPEIAKCFFNKQNQLNIDGRVICKKGEELCLKSQEAEMLGFSQGSFESVEKLVAYIAGQ